MPQFVYLDETGDTGFKFNKGSSRYFVVTLLLVSDQLPLHHAVDDLRLRLGHRETSEFKFYRSEPRVRREFLRMMTQHDLLIRALVIDKTRMTRPHMQKRDVFYNYLVKMILDHDNGRLQGATLILDKRDKNKKSQQALTSYLKRQLNAGSGQYQRVAEVRYHESHRDNLLQVVDMASGAINCRYCKGESGYASLIQAKIDDVWVWQPYQTQ